MRTEFMIAFFSCVVLGLVSCSSSNEPQEQPQRIVLYSSVDGEVLRKVVAVFEKQTGIRVDIVGDTEATKTTGLVTRLLAEKDNSRADVWWSSEPFGTIRLAREGVLEPYESPEEDKAFGGGGWPAEFRARDGTWYGLALRARVIAYAPSRVTRGIRLGDLRQWAQPKWKNRIGMARPAFGTTRGHMGALLHRWGFDPFEQWLVDLKSNGLRLYDGNATVVRAIAHGEIDVGLTDTDDVYAEQNRLWGLGGQTMMSFECDVGADLLGGKAVRPFVLPNTIGLVRGGPNTDGARAFVDFVLSGEVERIMAASISGNAPVHPVVAAEFPERALPMGEPPDYEAIADAIPAAMAICERVLGP